MRPAMTLAGTDLVYQAYLVARAAHAGQTDKVGNPYITHPGRVAKAVTEADGRPEAVAAAWLHDVVEDTSITLDQLTAWGFPAVVVDAVEALTHRPHEPRLDYYRRVRANEIAMVVKRADVDDNTSPGRMAVLDEETRTRLTRKYAIAEQVLFADYRPRRSRWAAA